MIYRIYLNGIEIKRIYRFEKHFFWILRQVEAAMVMFVSLYFPDLEKGGERALNGLEINFLSGLVW